MFTLETGERSQSGPLAEFGQSIDDVTDGPTVFDFEADPRFDMLDDDTDRLTSPSAPTKETKCKLAVGIFETGQWTRLEEFT
jgi:hypothetical protein